MLFRDITYNFNFTYIYFKDSQKDIYAVLQ